MEDQEAVSTVRRTRSAKAVKTPAKATKASKPSTRRTRKKVVLMEVEVSDDDESLQGDVSNLEKDGSDQEADEKQLEEKLLETPEESNESTDIKKGTEIVDLEKGELNGSGIVVDNMKSVGEDSITVVFNDVEMLQATEVESDTQDTNLKPEEKMEVDEEIIQSTKIVQVETPTASKSVESATVTSKVESDKDSKQVKISEKSISSQKQLEAKEKEDSDKAEQAKVEKVKKTAKVEKTKDIETEKKLENKVEKIKDVETEKKLEIKVEKVNSLEKSQTQKTPEKKIVDEGDDSRKCATKEDEESKKITKVSTESKKTAIEIDKSKKVDKESDESKKTIDCDKSIRTDKESDESKTKTLNKKVKIKASDISKMETDDIEENSKEEKNEKSVKDSEDPKIVQDTKSEENQKSTKSSAEESTKSSVEEATASNDIKLKNITDQDDKLDTPDKNADTISKEQDENQKGDPDAENISEDELPGVPVVKVPEAEEVSDEELPGPKRAELPADTEVVSEDELPTVKTEGKKEGVKRKLDEADYDPGSPTSESEAPSKKPSLEATAEKDEKAKPKKLPELDKYWKAVNDDPTDFTGWTYLLQYVDQENDMEAAREAYDAFLSHYPYCYGYWRKYADYEKRKGNKKKCEEVFERGLKAIPLSVDLWIHYLTYVKTSRPDEEDYVRSQFERALLACGLEFRSDRLWDSYIKWEAEGKRLQKVTAIYDRLLATPTQGYTSHFDNFQEHIASNPPNKVVEVDEFLALRKEVRHILKHDVSSEVADNSDAPPGDEDQSKIISSDEETKSIRERIVSIRRKIHKTTVNAVTARWNYEEGIKRPYFHVKPLERCQLKNWQDYLDYETEQGDSVRIIVLFERCLIACALYEEFWLKFVHYLENLKDPELQTKIRDVYERACTIHHLKKPNLHLQWAMFEESISNASRAAEILVNLEKSVPNVLQIAYRRINLERRRGDHEKCAQLYEHYISNSKNKMISSNIAIKYSRFCLKVTKNFDKAQEVLKTAITKDPNNPRLYLQLIDLTLQKENVSETEVVGVIDSFLDKESTDIDQKVLFAQRKLEYLEDFGTDIESVQVSYDQYQKLIKQSKDSVKKKEAKSENTSNKKEKSTAQSSSQSSSYGNYGAYGTSSSQPAYPYSGSQQGQYNYSQYGQGDQYQYQNWQYPQGGYGGYNQWGGYGGGYGY